VHLLTYNLDQHPFPSPAVKTPVSATQLTPQDPFPRAKVESAIRHGHHTLAPHHAQPWGLRSASGARQQPVPGSGTGVLAGAVVQPTYWSASSLMEMWGVMFRALSRVNPLFIIYRSHTTDCRGHCGHRPCPEQPQLNPTCTAENESCCGAARLCCTSKASRQQSTMKGTSWMVKNAHFRNLNSVADPTDAGAFGKAHSFPCSAPAACRAWLHEPVG